MTSDAHMSRCLTLWANHYLDLRDKKTVITDLFYDLRSGEILLDLLLILFSCDSTKDSGQLNVGKLNNISSALALLQKERVNVDSDLVTAHKVLQGDAEATLSLVWSIAFHYEARAALSVVSLPDTIHSPNIESLLTSWLRTVSPEADLATSSLSDGVSLANLVLASRPNIVSLTAALESSSALRPEKIYKAISSQLKIPSFPVPTSVDKRMSVLQLLLVMKSLKPPITSEVLSGLSGNRYIVNMRQMSVDCSDCPEGDPQFSVSSCKTPVRRIAEEQMLSLTSWTNVLEEVLSWLLEAEDHLLSLHSLGQKHLETVKAKFYNHEDFMLELKSHQSAVGEISIQVLSQGRNILSSSLSPDQSKDVRLQMKVLNERWEKVRELAMNKQTELHRLVMKLQVDQMSDLKSWMSQAEDKLSLIAGTAQLPSEVNQQLSDLSVLLAELEEQQGVVSGISNFILVDGPDSGLGQLEDELAALGERWVTLCRVCEQRQETLTRLTASWDQHRDLSNQLTDWMDRVEDSLKQMELDEEPDQAELGRQSQHVMETEEEFVKFEKKLELVCELGQRLAGGTISERTETVQDRWDVLIAILGAQKQRISRLGLELKHEQGVGNRLKKERESSEEVSVKKIEVSSVRYEKNEKSVSQLTCWADHILTRLDDGLQRLDLEDQQLLHEETEAEVRGQQEAADEVIKEGTNLISDLESQSESRPHLQVEPLKQLLTSCQAKREDIQTNLERLKTSIKYQIEKNNYFEKVEKLESLFDNSQVTLREVNLQDPGSLKEIEAQSEIIKKSESSLEEVKQAAQVLSVHIEATDDSTNSIKTFQYRICEKFEKLEEQLSSIKASVSQLTTSSEDDLSSGETVRNTQGESDSDDITESESKTETVYHSPVESGEAESNMTEPRGQERSQIKLESDLTLCKEFLSLPLTLHHPDKMEEEKNKIADHSQLFEDVFVPAHLSEDEAAELVDQMKNVKMELKQREEELEALTSSYFQWREELQGLSMWMKEVEVFLNAEEAVIGDILHLEEQVKESDALQDDVRTLQPNLELINETGSNLIKHCDISDSFHQQLQEKLSVLNSEWEKTVTAASEQNEKLKLSLTRSNEVVSLVSDLNQFLDQLETELASTESDPVTAAPQLSQRTFKLLQLREKTDEKSSVLHRLSGIEVGAASARVIAVQDRWNSVTGPVHENYGKMKEATSDYGEFKTLVAQETDWLDRLEKKLRRSSKCAADAEEISEELDDLENCLNNHPTDRLERLNALANALSNRDILISPVQTEAENLTKKWSELESTARLRIKSLEDCILEAQEWECKILAVQDWLQEKDLMLTSHLEHELTVEDIHDEAQQMLREFEDKENLLAEMEGQVDTYREEGKEEAAARLEDQLSLIHCKYQELSGKFELFQKPSDYDGRLGRITRQLVDLQSNMYLTELVSHEPEAIQGQLHHTRCVYNALANIKPEVEATIKMGRKLVETDSVSDSEATTKNIDHLKELFNLLGAQVTEARGNLEKALDVSEKLMSLLTEIFSWLEETEEMLTHDREPGNVMSRVSGMKNMKCRVRELLAVKTELISLCGDPSLLSGLKELLAGLEARWSEVKVMLQEAVGEEEDGEMKDLSLDSDDDIVKLESPGEESLLLQEFRAEFQDISAWMEETERKLEQNIEMNLGDLREGKIDNLAAMAMKIIDKFSAQSIDIEPEIESLKQRWRSIVTKIEQRKKSSPSPQPKAASPDPEEIVTLAEEQPSYQQTPLKRSFPVDSFVNYKSEMSSKIPRPTSTPATAGKEKKVPPPTLPKPRWYVESRRSNSPVKQVVVTSATLPSPRPSGTASKTVEVSKEPSPVKSEVTRMPASLDDDVLDRQLAKDHAEIDQLLQGASEDIEDVKARSLSRGSHTKDIKQFVEAANSVDIKLGQVKIRLDQISSESDLGLRCDLVDMETQQLEAEVTTLISRGETLVMIHRQDSKQAETLQTRVDKMKDSWQSVLRSADSKKSEAKSLSQELEKFLKSRDILLSWLEELRAKIGAAKGDKRELGALARLMELKKTELTNINKLGNKLTAANSFKGQESSLTKINQRWEAARQDCSLVSRRDHSKSASPKESLTKTYPAELYNKITRVREAVSAVEKQLSLSVLTGRKFEKLQQQQETLERVKTAIETLKPNIKKLEKDLELMSGATVSMEYFEKLTGLGEKCRDEWGRVNRKYQAKKDSVDEARFDLDRHEELEQAANLWLSSKEEELRNCRQNNKRELTANELLSKIEAEVEDWASFLSQFTELSRKISSESDGLQARRFAEVLENLEKRYKILSKGVMNKKNQNDILLNENQENIRNINITVSWAEDCLALITKQVNVSDVDQLLQTISRLEKAQAEAIKQRLALDEYSGQVGVNNPVYQQSRGKVERIIQMLPKRLGFLADRKERAIKLRESVAEFQVFVSEMRRRKNSTTSAPEMMKQRLAVTDKEFQMTKLNNDFLLLEREVTGGGMDLEPGLAADMKALKVSWLALLEDVRRAASSVNGNTEEVQSPAESVVSLGTISTTTSQEMMASPSTVSGSPLSDEVAATSPADTAARCKQVSAWLHSLEEETERMRIVVDNCEAVAKEVDKFRNLLQQLEVKKCQLEDMISSGGGHSQDNEINTVKADWRRVQQKLLGRKTELTAMLEHSDNLDSKGREVSEWLGKLERQLAGASVGKTRVVLLGQIREVNQVMRELQKYNHHVTLFTQMCQRLVSIYSRDITDGIHHLAGELSGRYSGLTTSCTARAKSLQTALENINVFDRELAEFLAWLGEMETSLERLDCQQQPCSDRLAELQSEVRTRDRQFCSLTGRGKDQLLAAGDTDIVLASKVGELGRRWSGLQNMMMGIQDKMERKEDARDRMEDILGWLAQKRAEVENIALGDTLTQVRRQLEENIAFRDKLEVKMAEFSNILQSYQMDSRLDEEWRKLIAVTDNLTRELELAEQRMADMELTLSDLDERLNKVENDQAAWSESPQLGAVEAETLAVEVISSELSKLEEDVMKARIVSDSAPHSPASAEKLVRIEQRLTEVREAVTRRRSQLKSLEVIPDPGTQEFLNTSVPHGWERALTEDYVPFFSCHQTEATQWDHPEFESLLQSVSAMNTVKFSAYRMALKLRKVQQKLCLDLLDINSAVVCFDSHGLGADKDDLTICVPEVVTVLTSIYETLYQCEPEDITVNLCVDLALNWILNVYDSQRQGFVRVLSFKLAIVLLCRGPLVEKYSVMFNIAAGETDKLDQRRLALFLYDLVMVPKYLGEVAQFGGTNIEPSVRSCLSIGATEPRPCVTCPQFVQWLQEEPQSLVWLPVLHRLASAETATHHVKCKICKVDPIVGFRYHCRKCFNLDICHACFFVGKTYKGCKPEHPFIEYCTSTTKTDNAKHILQAVRNSFRSRKYFKKKKAKLGYLPVQSVLEGENFESPAMSPNLSFESRDLISDSVGGSLAGRPEAEDDEHSLIAAYCKLLTGSNSNNNNISSTASILLDVDARVEGLEQERVEQMLVQLKEENAKLEAEYQQLASGKGNESVEEKTLRTQRSRLEARMTILEDHNRQLEAQLERLRQLVQSETASPVSPGLQARYVVAADLHHEEVDIKIVADRPQPPSASLAVPNGHSDRSSGSYSDEQRLSGTSGSLNLSQHNTETVQDDDI